MWLQSYNNVYRVFLCILWHVCLTSPRLLAWLKWWKPSSKSYNWALTIAGFIFRGIKPSEYEKRKKTEWLIKIWPCFRCNGIFTLKWQREHNQNWNRDQCYAVMFTQNGDRDTTGTGNVMKVSWKMTLSPTCNELSYNDHPPVMTVMNNFFSRKRTFPIYISAKNVWLQLESLLMSKNIGLETTRWGKVPVSLIM